MKRKTRAILAASALLAVVMGPVAAFAADDAAKADKLSWLTIGGDYRFRIDSLKGTIAD